MAEVEVPEARLLLTEMLACVRHSQDTPLYFGVDGHRIAARALRSLEAGLDPADSALADPTAVIAAIEALARAVLGVTESISAASGTSLDRAPLLTQLAEWLERTHERMCEVHPLALDILGLLVRGEGNREVARHLDFGLRLTERITAEMRAAW